MNLQCTCARWPDSRPAIASRFRCRIASRIRWPSSACLKAGLVMVNTNPLYTPAEMVHQFTDSGAVGLIAIDLFAHQSRRGVAEDVDQDRGGRQHFRPAAAGEAAADQGGAEVRQEDDPADHLRAHDVPGARWREGAIASPPGTDPQALRASARSAIQHRGAAIHRRHDRRRQGRDAHARQPGRQRRRRASRCGSRSSRSATR